MSRPRKKVARRPVKVIWVSWVPSMAELFDLAPASWLSPEKIKIVWGARHSTWVAVFQTPQGERPTITCRVKYGPDGRPDEVLDQKVGFHWSVTGEQLRDAMAARAQAEATAPAVAS